MIASIFKKSSFPRSLVVDGTDSDFDAIYPGGIRRHAEQHFTPLPVARRTAAFLVSEPGTKVLDIGSGAGKFCLIGAATTKGHFTGIEQRKELVALSGRLAATYGITEVHFVHGNVMAIDFKAFDSFYLFNPFYENVRADKRMDNAILLSPSLYESYSSYTSAKLAALPVGTRLATYFTPASMIPSDFKEVGSFEEDKLVFWTKQ
ncbi:MAG TPA: class I SAM-dependent methyltransferase [Chryseolinea sp.]|nr:class I SAM-dependent methyltransferase [Chryseolinea sp.]